MKKCERLMELCRELMGILEVVEVSNNEREFCPTTISSCRVLTVERLGKIIPEIKKLSEEGSE